VRAATHGCEPKRCQWKGDMEEVKMDDDGGEDGAAPLAPAPSRKRQRRRPLEEAEEVVEQEEVQQQEEEEEDAEALRLGDVVLCKFAGRKCLGQVIEIREDGSFDVQWWGQNSAPNGRFYPAWLDGDEDEVFSTIANAAGLAVSWAERLDNDVIIARVEQGAPLDAAHSNGKIPAHIRKQVGKQV
jgi:hypothetical protein